MIGSIQSLPAGNSTGHIDGVDGACYAFYLRDFSPEDIASGLEEFASVTFEPMPGEINRAMHCVLLRGAPDNANVVMAAEPITAEPISAESAESAKITPASDIEELPLLYSPPVPGPLLCKRQLPPEWEIISLSDWCVRGSSKKGSDEAQRMIAQRARELKANAILDMQYGTIGAAGEASTIHFFDGRLANVGKRDPNGKPREMLAADLNKAAAAVLGHLAMRRKSEQLHNYALYAVCIVATMMVASVVGFASLPTLIVGTIAVGLSVKLTKDTVPDAYVTHNPVVVPPAQSEAAGVVESLPAAERAR
jgi:hypothetical protein